MPDRLGKDKMMHLGRRSFIISYALLLILLWMLLGMGAVVQGTGPDAPHGTFWEEPMAPGGNILDLAIAPLPPHSMLALVAGAEWPPSRTSLFRSGDGAQTWEYITTFPHPLSALAIDPQHGNKALAGGDEALYLTEDGGLTWTQVYTTGQAVAIAPDGTYYAAGPENNSPDCEGSTLGIARSQDGGHRWEHVHHFCATDAIRIAIAPPPDGAVYVAARMDTNKEEYLWRSEDGGLTWIDVLAEHREQVNLRHWLVDVAIHPTNPNVLFLSDDIGLARSLDRGESWERIDNDAARNWDSVPPPHAYALAFDADGGLLIADYWAEEKAHLYRSDDLGVSWWQALETLPRGARRLIAHPQQPQRFYAGLNDLGIFISEDGGARWHPSPQNVKTVVPIEKMAASYLPPSPLYTVGDAPGGGFFRSEDSGRTWQVLLTYTRLQALAVDPRDPRSGWVGGWDGLYAFHEDRVYRYPYPLGVVTDITMPAAHPGTAYLTGYTTTLPPHSYIGRYVPPSGVHKGYWNWIELPHVAYSWQIVVHPTDADTLFLDGVPETKTRSIMRSEDGGITWKRILPLHLWGLTTILIDPQPPHTLYVAQGHTLYWSNDEGISWKEDATVPGKIADLTLDDLGTRIVATDNGLFYWDEGAGRWQPMGPDGLQGQSLLFQGGPYPKLYVGTPNGIWIEAMSRYRTWLPTWSYNSSPDPNPVPFRK